MKSITMLLLASGTIALSNGAFASWDAGPCSGGGTAPCVEATDGSSTWHFNGDGSHADEWHGHPNSVDDLSFYGESFLDCPDLISPTCNLRLNGQVKKCLDSNNDWRILIKVTGGSVTSGDLACGGISLGGFDWFANHTGIHSGFADDCDQGILYGGPLEGNIGDIDITYLGFIPVATNAHVHSVDFVNSSPSYFDFNSVIYEPGEVSSGCSVTGRLYIDNLDNITIN